MAQKRYDQDYKVQAVKLTREIGLSHKPKRKPNGITKADRQARKSDDLLKRGFKASEPLKKTVTDISEIKAKSGKLYVSVIFDCYDLAVVGISMDTNMKATLFVNTLDNAFKAYKLRGLLFTLIEIHSKPAMNIAI